MTERTASWIRTVSLFHSSVQQDICYWISDWPCMYKPSPLLDCPSILYPLAQLYNPHINPSLFALYCPRNMLACFLLGCWFSKSSAKAPCHTTTMCSSTQQQLFPFGRENVTAGSERKGSSRELAPCWEGPVCGCLMLDSISLVWY